VPIIEDSCQAFPNPPRGDIACYSLSTAKIIATGQGGFCATRDEALYKELKALRTHDVEDAMVPQVLEWRRFGYNFRFTDIQAAIGLAQLERLPERLEAIREIHAAYKAGGVPVCDTPTPLYNELLHPEPERLRKHLSDHGIEARPFYPSLHTAAYLRPPHKTKYHDYEFPNSAKWSKGLILPSGPCQKLEDIRRVCQVINDFR
jgi:dTDP-4-amino-4,6-dideoxygalactose transaminase